MQLLQQSSEKMKKKKVITRRGYTTSPIRKRKAKKKKNKTEEVKQKYVTLATWQGRQIPTAWPILTLHLCGSAALSPCCHSNITMAMLFINVSYACISLWLWLLEGQLEQIPVFLFLCLQRQIYHSQDILHWSFHISRRIWRLWSDFRASVFSLYQFIV